MSDPSTTKATELGPTKKAMKPGEVVTSLAGAAAILYFTHGTFWNRPPDPPAPTSRQQGSTEVQVNPRATTALTYAREQHRSAPVELDMVGLVVGTVSPAELAITLEGKRVAFQDVPDGIATAGSETIVGFNRERVVCIFSRAEDRLFAAKMRVRTGYRFEGDFKDVVGATVRLSNCTGRALDSAS